jgi:tetratricopeptide (TPR) repeat protein
VTARVSRGELIALAVLLAALLVIYLPGLGNTPISDDAYLSDGELFADYGAFTNLRTRMFSYGTFVWVQAILGDGWWKQRLVNLAIHLGVVVALWGLYREMLRHVATPAGLDPSPALAFAIGFFALNPVAVYAVAYLIQRSILLATLFVVLGLWLFARGLVAHKAAFHVAALLCYVLAVMSKENAILAPLATVPLYVLVARPSGKRLALIAAISVAVAAIAGYLLASRFGRILGTPFDEYSRVYLAQLAQLDPDAQKNAYPLSILNQAYLFFRYGVRWLLPVAAWMSINMRPAFPVSWTTLPHVLGIAGYVAVLLGGFYLLLRYRDWRALAGISFLLPALLFATEFATVWVQDPFVLYRSYLWAIGVPGLVFLLVSGTPPRVLLVGGLFVGALLAWQALDRVLSMSTAERAFTDAILKMPNDPRAVGRWFPYLNRGNAYLDRDQYVLARRDFESSATLGDQGMGMFNVGSMLALEGKHQQALAALDAAEKQGYTLYNLPFQRGQSLLALGKPEEAYRQFELATTGQPPSPARELILLNLGRTAMQIRRPQDAVRIFERLIAIDPRNKEGRYLLGMAYVMWGDNARALETLDRVVGEEGSGRAHYARALANYGLKRKTEAMADIDAAIRIGPDNQNLRQWQAKIRAMK